MPTFQDSAGHVWTIAINVDAIRRVREVCHVNLADPLETPAGQKQPLITRLETDVLLLCDVLYALVQPQAEAAHVSDEDFGRALGGDAILAAHNALFEGLSDFFQKLGRKEVVKVIATQTAMLAKTMDLVEKRLDSPAFQAKLDEALSQIGG